MLLRTTALAALLVSAASAAGPLRPADVPAPLKPWVDWALHGHEEEALCPRQLGAEARTCTWPGVLELQLDDTGGRFTLKALAAREDWLELPGGDPHWPQDVKVDGKAAVVTEDEGTPRLRLSAGEHAITGSFSWSSLPEALPLPEDTGTARLQLRGKNVPFPGREAGRVFLQRLAQEEAEDERLDLRVYRKVTDTVPLELTTRVELDISGKGREVLLGRALPEGFVPLSLDSELPARVEPDGRLRLQARAGRFSLTLVARGEGPVTALRRPAAGGPWAEDEIWVFEARPQLRQVLVEGVPALDASQTTLPGEWRALPAYGVGTEDALQLTERQRGNAQPEPDALRLSRTLWLDFDGNGYTVQDALTGQLRRSWRLDLPAPAVLGRVVSSGSDQLITRASPGGAPGVELRDGSVRVEADSRMEGPLRRIPAVGWDADFQFVTARLHLPPGWKLLHASGADEVPGTWVRNWTLLQIFLVVITALAAARLYGRGWGVLALGALVLLFPEPDAPHDSWLAVMAFEALARVLPHARLQSAARTLRAVTWLCVLLFSLPFLVDHVREGLFPALARPWQQMRGAVQHADYLAQEGTARNEAYAEPPGAPPAEQMPDSVADELDMAKGMRAALGASANALAGSTRSAPAPQRGGGGPRPKKAYAQAFDKNAQVQTGPGRPRWSWDEVRIGFNGPVQRGQELELWLLSPAANLALALLRSALLVAMLLLTLGVPRSAWGRLRPGAPGGTAAAALLLGVALALTSSPAAAEESPAQPLLDQLRDRLLEAPDCVPGCAALPRLRLEAAGSGLTLRMSLHAEAKVAVPLPGNASQWLPARVTVDGKETPALRRAADGTLWLAVSPGTHEVVAEGPLPARDTVSLALPLRPRHVEAKVDGWRLDGVQDDGEVEEGLQLTRLQKASDQPAAALEVGNLPPFLRVERTLQLGLQWTVATRVQRLSPAGSPVVAEVPLLPGESVTTPGARVQGGKVQVNLAPGATETSWSAVMEPAASVKLEAPPASVWTETWRVEASPLWHVEATGIPPIHPDAGERAPEWHPWPGESVLLALTRPDAVPGQTLTAEQGTLRVSPGLRATDATLTLNMRSSRGGLHPVQLPEGAELLSVRINGQGQPIRQEGRTVGLPLSPGAQTFELVFRQPSGITAAWQTPPLSVGLPVVNSALEVSLPERWVLFAHGPRMGPSVLFWSYLLVLMALAVALGLARLSPLTVAQWALLLLGLSQLPAVAGAVVVGWLLVLAWRGRTPSLGEYRSFFPLRQLILAGWTLVAFGVLAWAIQRGLLGRPDMQVQGNGSSAQLLQWFEDRTGPDWPRGHVYSLPLMAWRLAMLAWALWLARALLGWLRWGWAAFSTGGLWTEPPPAAPVPSESSPPPSSPA